MVFKPKFRLVCAAISAVLLALLIGCDWLVRASVASLRIHDAVNSNLEPTWKPRTVVVNNYTTEYLDVYVNGNYRTQVQPGMQQTFVVEHRWNPTVLKAYGNEDINTYGPRYIWGKFDRYTWDIE
jgi:hypothetical protein